MDFIPLHDEGGGRTRAKLASIATEVQQLRTQWNAIKTNKGETKSKQGSNKKTLATIVSKMVELQKQARELSRKQLSYYLNEAKARDGLTLNEIVDSYFGDTTPIGWLVKEFDERPSPDGKVRDPFMKLDVETQSVPSNWFENAASKIANLIFRVNHEVDSEASKIAKRLLNDATGASIDSVFARQENDDQYLQAFKQHIDKVKADKAEAARRKHESRQRDVKEMEERARLKAEAEKAKRQAPRPDVELDASPADQRKAREERKEEKREKEEKKERKEEKQEKEEKEDDEVDEQPKATTKDLGAKRIADYLNKLEDKFEEDDFNQFLETEHLSDTWSRYRELVDSDQDIPEDLQELDDAFRFISNIESRRPKIEHKTPKQHIPKPVIGEMTKEEREKMFKDPGKSKKEIDKDVEKFYDKESIPTPTPTPAPKQESQAQAQPEPEPEAQADKREDKGVQYSKLSFVNTEPSTTLNPHSFDNALIGTTAYMRSLINENNRKIFPRKDIGNVKAMKKLRIDYNKNVHLNGKMPISAYF